MCNAQIFRFNESQLKNSHSFTYKMMKIKMTKGTHHKVLVWGGSQIHHSCFGLLWKCPYARWSGHLTMDFLKELTWLEITDFFFFLRPKRQKHTRAIIFFLSKIYNLGKIAPERYLLCCGNSSTLKKKKKTVYSQCCVTESFLSSFDSFSFPEIHWDQGHIFLSFIYKVLVGYREIESILMLVCWQYLLN